jgi:hypothetical protein
MDHRPIGAGDFLDQKRSVKPFRGATHGDAICGHSVPLDVLK